MRCSPFAFSSAQRNGSRGDSLDSLWVKGSATNTTNTTATSAPNPRQKLQKSRVGWQSACPTSTPISSTITGKESVAGSLRLGLQQRRRPLQGLGQPFVSSLRLQRLRQQRAGGVAGHL